VQGACRRGRRRTAWMNNTNTWTELSVEESIRMTEDRNNWRKYVQFSDRGRLKNRTEQLDATAAGLTSDELTKTPPDLQIEETN